MWEDVKEAIKEKNFIKAQQLLEKIDNEKGNDLWKRYYLTRIEEEQKNWELAEENYRQIIQDSVYPDPKLIGKIRDGIERVTLAKKQEQEKIAIVEKKKKEAEEKVFTQIDNSEDLAILILKPVTLDQKKLLAPEFAKIIETDLYTANLQIPTRSWRIYKTGNYGKLSYYYSKLSEANIPCLCQRIEPINRINVYLVKYIKSALQELTVVCKTGGDNEENITFQWTQINQRVEGLIPIFESTVHIDVKGKMQKKPSTLDYANFYDLHINSSNSILRFSDYSYQFEHGVSFSVDSQTSSEKWKNLIGFFEEKLSDIPLNSEFTSFAEGLVQYPEMLKQIKSHINLFTRQDSVWDEAFQLYSGLILASSNLVIIN